MAARRIARRDTVYCERHDVGVLGLRPEGRDDGMQRPHPAERAGLRRGRAPAHRFRPREALHHLGHDLPDHLDRGATLLLDHRHIEIALLVGLHFGLIDGGQPRRLEEAADRAFVGADARALALLLHVGLARRHALHRERQPPRRRERPGAFVDEAGLHQSVGDELAQILGRARLHARGDFLGEEFDQEVGHGGPSTSAAGRRRGDSLLPAPEQCGPVGQDAFPRRSRSDVARTRTDSE